MGVMRVDLQQKRDILSEDVPCEVVMRALHTSLVSQSLLGYKTEFWQETVSSEGPVTPGFEVNVYVPRDLQPWSAAREAIASGCFPGY